MMILLEMFDSSVLDVGANLQADRLVMKYLGF